MAIASEVLTYVRLMASEIEPATITFERPGSLCFSPGIEVIRIADKKQFHVNFITADGKEVLLSEEQDWEPTMGIEIISKDQEGKSEGEGQ